MYKTSRTLAARAFGANGFWRSFSSPSDAHSRSCESSEYPEMNSVLSPGKVSRRRLANSTPLIFGITTSVTIRWIGPWCRSQVNRASPPWR